MYAWLGGHTTRHHTAQHSQTPASIIINNTIQSNTALTYPTKSQIYPRTAETPGKVFRAAAKTPLCRMARRVCCGHGTCVRVSVCVYACMCVCMRVYARMCYVCEMCYVCAHV